MDTNLKEAPATLQTTSPPVRVKVFGIGNAGVNVLELLMGSGFSAEQAVAVNTQELNQSTAAEKLQLETRLLRGLGSGGDPQRGRALAEEQSARLKGLCEGVDLVFVVAGLGGGCGTGAGPVVARLAKEAGSLTLGFVMTPFECEGSCRGQLAQRGFEEFKDAADGVVCLPNQKVFKMLDEHTSVIDAFKITNELLADAVRSVWRLTTHKGLIDIHFPALSELLRDQHTESAFAVAEALGPTRSRVVLDKLLAHPLLDNGAVLPESDAVLVSVMGGLDLTMAEVNRVMEEITAKCEGTRVTMGAAIHSDFQDRLTVTVIAARKTAVSTVDPRGGSEDLQAQLLQSSGSRTPSRFVPPAPVLPPEQIRQILARQGSGRAGRKGLPQMRQAQLPLEIVSKGRFDKSEPTIHKGEDLDVPTYIRRGVCLN